MPSRPSDPMTSPFVTTQWLAAHLADADLAIIDGSWYLPPMNRSGRDEFLAGHIPGAVHFDIDEIADKSSGLPHMLPNPTAFAEAMGRLGVGNGMRVVVYDGAGLFAAPRVWWTLRTFGVRDVSILEGGLPKWRAEGRPLDSGAAIVKPRSFTAHFDAGAVADLDRVKVALATGAAQIVDARPADRFAGAAPEPRPGVRSGHMPGALNLPFTSLIADGKLRPAPEILALFEAAGVDLSEPIVTSCGSGVSAAILSLALETAGKKADALYDGSWAEWGSRDDLPLAKL